MPTREPSYEPHYIEDWGLFEDEAFAAEAEARCANRPLGAPAAAAPAAARPLAEPGDLPREGGDAGGEGEERQGREKRQSDLSEAAACDLNASSPDAELAPAEEAPLRVPLPAMPRHDPEKSDEEGVWLPALFSRSSLFAAFAESKKAGVGKRLLATHGPYTLWLEGPRLNMIDKATWEAFVEAAWAKVFAGEEVELSLGAMARARGAVESGPNARVTTESLARLAQARISFERRDKTGAALVKGEAFMLRDLRQLPAPPFPSRRGGAWMASLDKDLVPLFQKDLRFESAPARRAALSTRLARWLHDYFASHKAYEGHKVSALRRLCGYDGRKDAFPSQLRAALDELVRLAPRCVSSYKLRDEARDSDEWTLSVQRSEAPAHGRDQAELEELLRAKQPVAEAPKPAEGAKRGSKAAKRGAKAPKGRGGVAL